MDKNEYSFCDECGSKFLKSSSKMMALCSECAHILIGSTLHRIFIATSRAETAMTTESYKFKFATIGQPYMAPPKAGAPQ